MQHVTWLVAAMVAACAARPAEPLRPPPTCAAPPCVDEATAAAAVADNDRANERRFAAALAAAGLDPVPQRSVDGPVVGGGGPVPDVARRGDQVFAIDRVTHPGPAHTVHVCGCRMNDHSRCGGELPPVISFDDVLPEHTSYAGRLPLDVAVETVTVDYGMHARDCRPVPPAM
jgi:hypothetical protein